MTLLENFELILAESEKHGIELDRLIQIKKAAARGANVKSASSSSSSSSSSFSSSSSALSKKDSVTQTLFGKGGNSASHPLYLNTPRHIQVAEGHLKKKASDAGGGGAGPGGRTLRRQEEMPRVVPQTMSRQYSGSTQSESPFAGHDDTWWCWCNPSLEMHTKIAGEHSIHKGRSFKSCRKKM